MNIELNEEMGEINLSGVEYYEHSLQLFEPVFDWLERYTKEGNKKITLNIKLAYFISSTSRRLLDILNILEDYQNNNSGEVIVNWYYQTDNLDMKETGEEYAEDLKLPFNLIPC
ncbi:MAG: DUF1987 domain-containing protein [Cytophagales bacterium]|nr:MAG: DUF1987 domain-containing protein [Cytophagales bacterium]